jgi:DNA-binding response OmpR family regulator
MRKLPRLLIVDDEPQIRRLLRNSLPPHGYECVEAEDAATALAGVAKMTPDLVLLDLGLPDGDGFAIIERIRETALTPIVVLSARSDVEGKVRALELGADDYVTKPFSIRELLARVKAVLRRTAVVPKEMDQHSFADVEVDLKRCRVLKSGRVIDVSSKEFELLKYFICHSGEVLSRDRLLEEVWGYENYPTTRTVDTHLVRLRQKLEPDPEQPQYFLTVHGTGYRFVG